MSRQSKQRRNNAIKKQFSELRKTGGSGPAKTKPQHGKKKAFWQVDKKKVDKKEDLKEAA